MQPKNTNELSSDSVAALETLLNGWIGSARWFTSDRNNPQVQIMHGYPLTADATSSTTLLIVRSGEQDYFVPVTLNTTDPQLVQALAKYPAAVLGYLTVDGKNLMVTDSTEHPSGQLALLRACFGELATSGVNGHSLRGSTAALPTITDVRKLRSEQSNTSIIFQFASTDDAGSTGLIMKLFRLVHPGTNPDVQLQTALDQAGTGTVPKQYSSASVTLGAADDALQADLLVAQEFLAGAKDAWQVFLAELSTGVSSPQDPDAVFELGTVTADIHQALANSFPTQEVSAQEKSHLRNQWQLQADKAIAAAPKLAQYREQIATIFDNALEVKWPRLQRIHGDYHLGQVLHVPRRGWVALDFEGEPLKPLAQRTQPSLALRDVAGMLRSFTYAAGAAELNGKPHSQAESWAKQAAELFLTGYGALSPDEDVLLRALMLDKAFYEVVYEATYRPRWLQIPVQSIAHLLD